MGAGGALAALAALVALGGGRAGAGGAGQPPPGAGGGARGLPSPWAPGAAGAACGRAGLGPGPVCDPGGLLGTAGVEALDALLAGVRAGGRPEWPPVPCGGGSSAGLEVGIAVVPGGGGGGRGLGEEGAREAAKALHREWGVGRPDCGNGALVFVSVADRRVFVSTGEGARRLAPDWLVAQAVAGMRPDLRRGAYAAALARAVEALARGAPGVGLSGWLAAHWETLAFLAFAAWAVLLAARAWRAGRRRAKCAQLLLALERDRDGAQAEPAAYEAASCAVCLEEWGTSVPLRERVALRCGHAFCRKCLEGWVTKGPTATCPICRAPLEPGGGAPSSRAAAGTSSESGRGGGDGPAGARRAGQGGASGAGAGRRGPVRGAPLGEEHPFWDEYAFRVRNVQRRYPDLVGGGLTEDLLSGRFAAHGPLCRHPHFPGCEPPNRGARGGRRSEPFDDFGGGDGDGGGGAGGARGPPPPPPAGKRPRMQCDAMR